MPPSQLQINSGTAGALRARPLVPFATTRPIGRSSATLAVPSVSPWLFKGFALYARAYIKKHFHALRLCRAGQPPAEDDAPLVVYANHASWWDPLVGLVLGQTFFPRRNLFAPMAAESLEKYRMLARLGFFGVEQNSVRGAATFLRTSLKILRWPSASLWITPQGQFGDPRDRPIRFKPGLGQLAQRVNRALFVPLAIEYPFWEERTPEVLAAFGEPVLVEASHIRRADAKYWTALFEQKLSATLDRLARASQRRIPEEFTTILRGRAGVGLLYDGWRKLRARLRGETFANEHGAK